MFLVLVEDGRLTGLIVVGGSNAPLHLRKRVFFDVLEMC
jgi:hypothetical protein